MPKLSARFRSSAAATTPSPPPPAAVPASLSDVALSRPSLRRSSLSEEVAARRTPSLTAASRLASRAAPSRSRISSLATSTNRASAAADLGALHQSFLPSAKRGAGGRVSFAQGDFVAWWAAVGGQGASRTDTFAAASAICGAVIEHLLKRSLGPAALAAMGNTLALLATFGLLEVSTTGGGGREPLSKAQEVELLKEQHAEREKLVEVLRGYQRVGFQNGDVKQRPGFVELCVMDILDRLKSVLVGGSKTRPIVSDIHDYTRWEGGVVRGPEGMRAWGVGPGNTGVGCTVHAHNVTHPKIRSTRTRSLVCIVA